MGEAYVELMWRVIKDKELRAAFRDLQDAEEYAKQINGTIIVIQHQIINQAISTEKK